MNSTLSSASPQLPGFFRSVWILLRLRWVIWVGEFRRARLRRKIGLIVVGLLALAGLGLIFFVSWLLLSFLRSPELMQFVGDIGPVLQTIPILIVSLAFLGIMITSFGLLLQALYLSKDMDFLLSAPLPIHAVFVAKMLQAILPNFCLILLFSLPVLFGMGVFQGYDLVYYPLSIILLGVLALAAAGLSSLLVMLVVRLFPARRVSEVLALFVGVISILCSQSGQLFNFEDFSEQQATQVLNALSGLNRSWSPLAWAGESLVALGEGRWLVGAGLSLLTIVLAGGIFYGSLRLAERWYFTGWSKISTGTRKMKTTRRSSRQDILLNPFERIAARLFSPAVQGIIGKDFTVLRRDLRNLSQLVTPFIFGVIYGILLLRGGDGLPAGRGEAPPWFMNILENLAIYGNVGISLFVSWSLIGRLAGMGFSQEGRNYWLLKVAPVSVWQLLTSKFLVAFLPGLVTSAGFLIVLSLLQSVPARTILFSLYAVTFCIAGLAGLNLAFGVAGANFEWEDPRHMMRGATGCVGALASLVFLGISLISFFGPSLLAQLLGLSLQVGAVIGLALGSTVCLTAAILPPWLISKRIPHLGEK